MRDIAAIREHPGKILAVGSYKPGYQAILDFDALCGRESPSIAAIVGSNKRFEKYFWGSGEILIPCFRTIAEAKVYFGDNVDLYIDDGEVPIDTLPSQLIWRHQDGRVERLR